MVGCQRLMRVGFWAWGCDALAVLACKAEASALTFEGLGWGVQGWGFSV